MSAAEDSPVPAGTKGFVARIQNILLKPREEWEVISGEDAPPAALYARYVLALAAIGPVASLIGLWAVGIGISAGGLGSFHFHMPFGRSLLYAVIAYILALGAVYVLGLIIDFISPNFGGEKNFRQAFKVAVYASIPAWLGGIFHIFPAIAFIGGIIGLYGLYLLYLGVPALMKVPRERALPCTVVIIVAAIIIYVLIGIIASAITFGGHVMFYG
ncbi:MAG: Yip1 family protein [Gammaproteobacteria bacterium]